MSNVTARANWGSRLGFILAAAGSAVGLGAIWKFPFVAGRNGGGVFLLAYLGCVFTIGLALLLAEMSIGRMAKRSATTAFRNLGGKGWAWAGRLSVLCVFIILSYYNVVGGWTIAYLFRSITGEAVISDLPQLKAQFGNFVADPMQSLMYTFFFLAVTAGVVLAGVEKGIERMSKILMPALFVLMLILIGRALTLPGAIEGVKYFITPDFSKLTGQMLIDALGLACFSLSLGGGMIIAYGSYVPSETKLTGAAMWVALLATLACVLAGLMILPAVFAFGVSPNAGPGLTFITMPALFAKMPGGQFFAVCFFLLLLFAALTSSVSILEPIVSFLIDEFKQKRLMATLVVSAASFAIGVPSALSQGVLEKSHWIGERNPFDSMDYLAQNIMMPAGALLVSLFVGWVIWAKVEQELNVEKVNSTLISVFKVIARYIAPVVIVVIWFSSL